MKPFFCPGAPSVLLFALALVGFPLASFALDGCSSKLKLIDHTYAEAIITCDNHYALYIAYGEDIEGLDQQTDVVELTSNSPEDEPISYKKQFTLTGLLPGTVYFYRVMQDVADCDDVDVLCEASEGLISFETAAVTTTPEPTHETTPRTSSFDDGCSSKFKLIDQTYAEVIITCYDQYALYIAYGKDIESLDQQTEVAELKSSSSEEDKTSYKKQFTLAGLLPGTAYFYRVMHDAANCDDDVDMLCAASEGLIAFETAAVITTPEPTAEATPAACKIILPILQPEVVLSRPTDTSIMAVVLSSSDMSLVIHNADSQDGLPASPLLKGENAYTLAANMTQRILIDGLQSGTQYYYRLDFAHPECSSSVQSSSTNFFTTAPTTPEEFQFVVTADTHWQGPDWDTSGFETTLESIYLLEAAAGKARFMIELGDTFMGDKLGLTEETIHQPYEHLFQLYSTTCHSLPLFLVNGNHEGENGWYDGGGIELGSRPVWTAQTRKQYFANPEPDNNFYTGNEQIQFPDALGLQEDYYSWEWGNALFVALTPFWYTEQKGDSGWDWTLGEQQYYWLSDILDTSDATFRFVFTHQLLGGAFGNATERDYGGVGGAEWAQFFEWGGLDEDGEYKFNDFRPDWDSLSIPVHEMLVQADARTGGRSMVFKGHDHLYAKTALDDDSVVYQTVPQPWGGSNQGKQKALEKGVGAYNLDDVLDADAGYLSVTVSDTCATVAFRSPDGTEVEGGEYSVCTNN